MSGPVYLYAYRSDEIHVLRTGYGRRSLTACGQILKSPEIFTADAFPTLDGDDLPGTETTICPACVPYTPGDPTDVLSVKCPRCEAPPGVPCRGTDQPHDFRRLLASIPR